MKYKELYHFKLKKKLIIIFQGNIHFQKYNFKANQSKAAGR